ncbi:restriction endonuclease subunit S [Pontibacter sp. FD36]|uniref:restriction endonuclease subunit S n=1 Tax=Pontibacter sp. FD36 TaxID=2789860 RepID=UPI0018A9ADB6|nr:restriction endonuclease subunit S [Pontibacter sp. FD36]MBF8962149.1 restriction endonuclease subunit S [Pontibacter sp. FD36]
MMKRYDSYKDSGVEWIGEVPEHWGQQKLKYVARVQPSNVDKKSYDNEQPTLLCNYVDVYKNEFIVADMNFMEATATPDEIKKFRVDEGDVLVTKDSESADDIAVPAYVKESLEGVTCGYHLTQIKPDKKNLLGGYLFRLLQTPRYNNQFKVFANGVTRYGLSIYYFENAVIPLPSVDEQKVIANFLDDKTFQIDILIQKKQQMIALLEEEKTAVINEVVTKGLNPDVPMKESGIEWLGVVPAHWEVKKLKYLVKDRLMYGANESAELEDRSLPRYIRITDFGNNGRLREETFKSLPQEVAENYLLSESDILFARSGATVGKTFQFKGFEGIACFAGYLIKAKPDTDKILSDLLYFYTKSAAYEAWKDSIFIQATIQNIGADKYNQLMVPVPPMTEQDEIVSFITKLNNNTERLNTRIQQEIDLLQEYRTALISEAVTGKIDVRDYQPEPIISTALA